MKRLLLSILVILSGSVMQTAQAQDIYTYAGVAGPAGYGGDGGYATIANLNSPFGMATDAAGNVYIADTRNNIVRMVSPGGIISTFAGNNGLGAGYSGDGGPANAAQLSGPSDVAVDAAGNVYIADTRNNVVRVVSTSGIINTVAGNNAAGAGYSGDGGTATAAQLSRPSGVAVDATGNIYISDTRNQVIREVIASTGIINTIAGNNASGAGYSGDGGSALAAQLSNPAGLLVSGGNVYIADSRNDVIRIVDTTGTINTFAGTGTIPGYTGDGGAAVSAELSEPTAVKADASGNIYIADRGNSVVRIVDITGNINTFAGNGTAGYSGDGGLATLAEMATPQGLTIDASGNLYIACSGNNAVRRVGAAVTGITITSNTGDTVCYNTLVSFTATAIADSFAAHYQWLQNGAYAGADTSVFTPTSFATGDIINCILYNAAGDTQAISGALRIDTLPIEGTIAGPATLCVGSVAIIRDVTGGGPGGGGGAGGTWVTTDSLVASLAAVTGGPGGGGRGGETITGVATGTDTIYNIASNVCGADSASLIVTVVSNPYGPISGADSVCAGDTATYSDASTGGIWNVTPARGGNTIDSLTGLFTAATFTPPFPVPTIIAYGTPGCEVTYTVTVVPLPTLGMFSGTTTIDSGATTTFSETSPGGLWSSEDTLVVKIDSMTGDVTAVGLGSAVVNYSITNASGCTTDTSVIVTVVSTSGVANVANGNSFALYPNPAGNTLNITWAMHSATSGDVTIADVSGRTVFTGKLDMSARHAAYDISALNAGVYMVRIQAGDTCYTAKLVVAE